MVSTSNRIVINIIIKKFLKKLYDMFSEPVEIKYNYTIHVYQLKGKTLKYQEFSVNDISDVWSKIPSKLYDKTYDIKVIDNRTNHFINFNL